MDNTNSIWIVTDDIPQISLPDGKKGGNATGGGEETRNDETKSTDNAVQVDAEKLEQEINFITERLRRCGADNVTTESICQQAWRNDK